MTRFTAATQVYGFTAFTSVKLLVWLRLLVQGIQQHKSRREVPSCGKKLGIRISNGETGNNEQNLSPYCIATVQNKE